MPFPRLVLALGASILSGVAVAQIAPPPGGMGIMGALMRADANHDGIVTREEVIASADQMFDRLDADRNGTVTPDEMAAARPMRMRGDRPPPRADGTMPPPAPTAGRTPPAAGAMPPPPGGPMARSFTRQQWHDRALAQFDRVDANHDGRVDRAEMEAYRTMMRERRMQRRGGGDMPPPPPPPPPPANQ